jgi:glycosyltransferase involved in cell wall biosynthesis
MLALLDDPEGAARMGDRARHLAATRFSWEAVAREMLAVYRELTPAA